MCRSGCVDTRSVSHREAAADGGHTTRYMRVAGAAPLTSVPIDTMCTVHTPGSTCKRECPADRRRECCRGYHTPRPGCLVGLGSTRLRLMDACVCGSVTVVAQPLPHIHTPCQWSRQLGEKTRTGHQGHEGCVAHRTCRHVVRKPSPSRQATSPPQLFQAFRTCTPT